MTMQPTYHSLLTEREGPVLTLRLNRPDVRNAMSLQMVDELLNALNTAENDAATRVIVLRGSGGHFCAGADLRDMAQARSQLVDDPQALAKVNAKFGQLCFAFSNTPLAVIALLEGSVMGGGIGLACAADIAIADRSTLFRLPETSLGLVPAQIIAPMLERLGFAQTKRLAVTGGSLSAEQALAIGLIHEVSIDNAQLEDAKAQSLGQILRCAPKAIAATKSLLQNARHAATNTLIEPSAQIFSQSALGEEGIEGTLAFLQKRKPSWAIS